MDGIIYLTLEQAEVIHKKTIKYSGGGIYEYLDIGKLDSVLQHIQNDEYYPTFVLGQPLQENSSGSDSSTELWSL